MTCCTWVMSLVLRETSVGAPNRESSWAENCPTRVNTEERTSRPSEADDCAPIRVAPIVAMICTNDTTSMTTPVLRMNVVSPTATPSSMIRPLRLGRYSEASVATSWRTRSTPSIAAYGVR